jgi:hypothetical protein
MDRPRHRPTDDARALGRERWKGYARSDRVPTNSVVGGQHSTVRCGSQLYLPRWRRSDLRVVRHVCVREMQHTSGVIET